MRRAIGVILLIIVFIFLFYIFFFYNGTSEEETVIDYNSEEVNSSEPGAVKLKMPDNTNANGERLSMKEIDSLRAAFNLKFTVENLKNKSPYIFLNKIESKEDTLSSKTDTLVNKTSNNQ